MSAIKVKKITIHAYRNFSQKIKDLLANLGIRYYYIAPGRVASYRERTGLFKASSVIEEDYIDIFHVLVLEEACDTVLNILISEVGFDRIGHGAIYAEDITLSQKITLAMNKDIHQKAASNFIMQKNLMGISCIVQRGNARDIVRTILDMGISVPVITFGTGTGLRDKLGLLRITIPAEKEIITFVLESQDSYEALNILIDVGRLDQPGKGFIYKFPIEKGIINTRVFRGEMRHAASMEQIISAIDTLHGNFEWRKKDTLLSARGSKERPFFTNLIKLTFLSNEGKSDDLLKAAMSSGSTGATTSRIQHQGDRAVDGKTITNARDMCDMAVSLDDVERIIDALEAAGLFDNETNGSIEISEIPTAYTYISA